ncbi:MAG: TRAP transporter large permease subunit [Gammaproteobacteria bacterium]|jgi:tripartite ATP-independent transporter DctM subunit
MLPAVVILLLLAVFGLPLFAVLAAGSLFYAQQSDLDSAVLILELNRIATSPNLTTIPLFTLAGVVLAAGGAPQRLIRLFNALLGWLPGGLAVVAIAACAFFTSFSGASGVTILALGGLLYPVLSKVRYPERFNLGLLTTSGSLGLLFPPSLAILLYGIVAGVNIDDMFVAGIVPGIVLMFLLAIYAAATGRRFEVSRHPFDWNEALTTCRSAIGDIMLPLLIIVGIFGGFVTVTEAAACTALYVLVLEGIVHRSIALTKQLVPLLADTAVLVGSILIILGVAMGLTNLMIDAQLPMKLLSWIEQSIDSQLKFLVVMNVFLLAVGAMMDIFSAIVVIVPLLLPLAQRFGVDPVHLGIIFLANLEIGYSTPPVGINLFIASQRFEKPVHSLFRATLPFLGLMLIWLMIVTYLPALSLWWR